MGLSPKERSGLINRPTNAHERATNDVRVRKKLAAWLKEFDDMTTIFLSLPPEQLRKELSDIHVHRLSLFFVKTMEVLNYHPIVGKIDDPDNWEVVIDSSNWIESRFEHNRDRISRPVTNSDIERAGMLVPFFEEFKLFFGNNNPVVEASQLAELLDDPKLRSRITKGEWKGIDRINAAMAETFFDKDGHFKGYSEQDQKADNAQRKRDIEAKREAR